MSSTMMGGYMLTIHMYLVVTKHLVYLITYLVITFVTWRNFLVEGTLLYAWISIVEKRMVFNWNMRKMKYAIIC
jgi:hypothetical protein